MALTRDRIIDRLVWEYGLQRREAIDLYDTFIEDMKLKIENGERVRWAGFGTFRKKQHYYKRKRADVEQTDNWRVITLEPAVALKKRIQRASVVEARDVD